MGVPRKLIILYTANYCNKMRNVFEVETLIKDYNVEFWNLSKITAHEELAPAHTEGLKEIEVETLFQFRKLVKNYRQESTVYASVMGYGYMSCGVFLILSFYKCKYITVTNGTLPAFPMATPSMPIGMRIRSLFSGILRRTPLIKAADYALISSKKARVFYKTNSHTIRINSNSGDYIDAMRIKKNNSSSENRPRYIVFLDQYTPFHGDYKLLGLTTIEEGYYFGQVNSYLKKLEQYYNCEVIIAAHPSALKYKDHNYFNGRKIVFNQTAQLVLNSIGVLTHNTTAVSYAVVYKKPIIFMNMPGFCDYDLGIMKLLAEELQSKIVDISKSSDVKFDDVPNLAYNNYLSNYLTLSADGKTNAQIFSEILKDY